MTAAEQLQEARETVAHAGGSTLPLESTTLGKLAEALAKAQLAIEPAVKDSTNPHFKSRYADLASIREVIRKPLAENGLAYYQRTSSRPGGVRVETTLVHVSGEFVRDSCWLPVAQATPQAYGSAITYARRYSLAALVGVVADEDDDGNAASVKTYPVPQTEALKAAIRQKQARMPEEPPPPTDDDAPMAEPPDPEEFIIGFGKSKGQPASSLSDKDLAWYSKAYRENAADPAKARFREQNAAAASALEAIAQHRGLT